MWEYAKYKNGDFAGEDFQPAPKGMTEHFNSRSDTAFFSVGIFCGAALKYIKISNDYLAPDYLLYKHCNAKYPEIVARPVPTIDFRIKATVVSQVAWKMNLYSLNLNITIENVMPTITVFQLKKMAVDELMSTAGSWSRQTIVTFVNVDGHSNKMVKNVIKPIADKSNVKGTIHSYMAPVNATVKKIVVKKEREV